MTFRRPLQTTPAARRLPRRIGVPLALLTALLAGACADGGARDGRSEARVPAAAATPAAATLPPAEREAIADSLAALLRAATDLARPGDPAERMLALYPDSGSANAGRVLSASGGTVMRGRDSLARSIRGFWRDVGQNMVRPEWRWGEMYVDVLAPDAAVVTAAWRVPHLTPTGHAHVIGGAWTAVFANRDGRWAIVQEHLSDVVGGMSLTP